MAWQGLWIGIRGITVADMPDKPGLHRRLTARLFGGASGGVFRGMATLALGSGIGRVIGIVSIPVLTRLYSPEDFGVLAVFTAFVAILAPLVTLRYVLALPLPRHDGVAMNLLVVASGLMLTLTAIVTLVLWLWSDTLLSLVSMQVLSPWWWLIALGVLGTATYEMLTMWATRKRAYKVIAQTNVTQSAAGGVIKIGMGLAALQPIGLLVGQVVAQAGGTGRLLLNFFSEFRGNWRHVRRSRLRMTAWRHRGFPIFRLPSQILLVFSQQFPLIFAASLFGTATAGQLGLALSVLAVPLSLIGGSMGKALYSEAANIGMRDPLKVYRIVRMTQKRLFLIAIIPAILLFLFGPYLFRFLFGDQWETAGQFASVLSIYLVFQFTSAPLMQVINLLEVQYVFLIITFIRALLTLSLFWIVDYFGMGPENYILLLSTLLALFYVVISLLILFKLKSYAILVKTKK